MKKFNTYQKINGVLFCILIMALGFRFYCSDSAVVEGKKLYTMQTKLQDLEHENNDLLNKYLQASSISEIKKASLEKGINESALDYDLAPGLASR